MGVPATLTATRIFPVRGSPAARAGTVLAGAEAGAEVGGGSAHGKSFGREGSVSLMILWAANRNSRESR